MNETYEYETVLEEAIAGITTVEELCEVYYDIRTKLTKLVVFQEEFLKEQLLEKAKDNKR